MNKLILAESFNNADMYYATGILVPDPFVYLLIEDKEYVIVNKLEFGRVKKDIKNEIEVVLMKNTIEKDLLDFLKEKGIKEVSVPFDFPVKYADLLRGNEIKVIPTVIFPERITKTEEEVEKILQTQKVIEKAYDKAIEIIKSSDVKEGVLFFKNQELTSEKIKEEINIVFIKNQVEVADTIVSNGESSAYPHDLGWGVIKAGEPIILDIYPRSSLTRYYSDMTRTVCKGEPNNPKLKEMYEAVIKAQDAGFSKIKDGVDVREVHEEVVKVFDSYGMNEYFIHGTGHAVGLEVHEEPRISNVDGKLKEGMVITNEPGLYIPGVGGIRIEDTILVTKDGYKNLATSSKEFII